MKASATFEVSDMQPTGFVPEISTGLPTSHLHMVKTFSGDLEGRSITQFSAAFDPATGVGTYVAMESFEGTLGGRRGAFNFAHAASTSGSDRTDEYGVVVRGSGTGELAGITGTVRLGGADGHRFELDYEIS
jgi:hypothetical protein